MQLLLLPPILCLLLPFSLLSFLLFLLENLFAPGSVLSSKYLMYLLLQPSFQSVYFSSVPFSVAHLLVIFPLYLIIFHSKPFWNRTSAWAHFWCNDEHTSLLSFQTSAFYQQHGFSLNIYCLPSELSLCLFLSLISNRWVKCNFCNALIGMFVKVHNHQSLRCPFWLPVKKKDHVLSEETRGEQHSKIQVTRKIELQLAQAIFGNKNDITIYWIVDNNFNKSYLFCGEDRHHMCLMNEIFTIEDNSPWEEKLL